MAGHLNTLKTLSYRSELPRMIYLLNQNMSTVLLLSMVFLVLDSGIHSTCCEAFFISPNPLKPTSYDVFGTNSFKTAINCRVGVAAIAMQSQKRSGDFLDMFVGAVTGLVSVTGSTIDFRDASDRPSEVKPAVEDNSQSDFADANAALYAELVGRDLDSLLAILSNDDIGPDETWNDLLHNVSCSLVSCVAESSRLGTNGNYTLPAVHFAALRFLGRLQDQIRATDAKLYSSFKWVAKKHGLSPLVNRALDRSNAFPPQAPAPPARSPRRPLNPPRRPRRSGATPPSFPARRERVACCRDVERASP
jgi:hypothetical protein